MEKVGCVRVIEGEEVRGDDPVEYFFSVGVGSDSWLPETLEEKLKSPRMKRFLEEERMEGEKESVLPSVGKERIGGAYTLRNDSEEELF